MELEAKYEALLKKYSGKTYIAEGKCWDVFYSNEKNAKIYNYVLMAYSRNKESSSLTQVPSLITIDMFVFV